VSKKAVYRQSKSIYTKSKAQTNKQPRRLQR